MCIRDSSSTVMKQVIFTSVSLTRGHHLAIRLGSGIYLQGVLQDIKPLTNTKVLGYMFIISLIKLQTIGKPLITPHYNEFS